MDQHIYATMMNEDTAESVRIACARALLSSANAMSRSGAYWWLAYWRTGRRAAAQSVGERMYMY